MLFRASEGLSQEFSVCRLRRSGDGVLEAMSQTRKRLCSWKATCSMTGRERVYCAIQQYRSLGQVPTIRELRDAAGFKSTSSVVFHLEYLRRAGKVRWEPMKCRSIRLTEAL